LTLVSATSKAAKLSLAAKKPLACPGLWAEKPREIANNKDLPGPDPAEIAWKILLRSYARVGNGVETLIYYRQG